MNVSSATSVAAATAAAQSPDSDDLSMAVLKKAMDSETIEAASMIQAIPPAPAAAPSLATSGSLGRQVNTFA